jgi:hypothetical protein
MERCGGCQFSLSHGQTGSYAGPQVCNRTNEDLADSREVGFLEIEYSQDPSLETLSQAVTPVLAKHSKSFSLIENFRVAQFTRQGSGRSISFGKGVTAATWNGGIAFKFEHPAVPLRTQAAISGEVTLPDLPCANAYRSPTEPRSTVIDAMGSW